MLTLRYPLLLAALLGLSACCLAPAGQPDAGPPVDCTINGSGFLSGTQNPQNSCQSCQAASSTDWTNLADGAPCGNGGFCFAGTCAVGCFIAGAFYPSGQLDEQTRCRICSPNQNTTDWTLLPVGTHCEGSNECDATGTCGPPFPGCTVGSVRVPNRAANPSDPSLCCNVGLDKGAWSRRFVDGGSFTGIAPTGDVLFLGVGDFNNDHFADVALSDLEGSQAVVYISQAGQLATVDAYPLGHSPSGIFIADLNMDGFADLVATNTDRTLSVLMNQGDGTFGQPTSYTSCTGGEGSLVAGDFNGDSIPDLACGCGLMFFGIGDGGLYPPVDLPVTGVAKASAADFNKDGRLDLILDNIYTGVVSPLLADGAGTFSLGTTLTPTGPAVLSLVSGDFSNTGLIDLAVQSATIYGSTWIKQGVALIPGVGGGQFGPSTWIGLGDGYPGGIATATLAGDNSHQLLVSTGPVVGQVVLEDAGLSMAPLVSGSSLLQPSLGDFNGDAADDLYVITQDGQLDIYINGCP